MIPNGWFTLWMLRRQQRPPGDEAITLTSLILALIMGVFILAVVFLVFLLIWWVSK